MSNLQTELETKLNAIIQAINLRRKIIDSYSATQIDNLFYDKTIIDSKLLEHYLKSESDLLLLEKINYTDIIDNLISTDTDKPLSGNQGKVLKDLIDSITTGTDNTPIGSLVNIDSQFESLGLSTISDKYRLCNGQVIDQGVYINKRTPNLIGNTNTINASITSGNAIITVNTNDVLALNVGDTVSGTGIAIGTIISAINYTNGQVTLSKLTGTWNTTTNTYNPDNTCVTATNSSVSLTIIGFTFDVGADGVAWDLSQRFLIDTLGSFSQSGLGANNLMFTGVQSYQSSRGGLLVDSIGNRHRGSIKTKNRTRKINWYIKVL